MGLNIKSENNPEAGTANQGDLTSEELKNPKQEGQVAAPAPAAESPALQVAEEPEEVADIRLVLAGDLKRYTRHGLPGNETATFTDQKIYLVTKSQAVEMLGWEIDDVPVFKRYKAQAAKRRSELEDEQEHIPASKPREVVLAQEPNASKAINQSARRIDVGSPEEEAALFGGLDNDADGVSL